jgi:hypothetical protein
MTNTMLHIRKALIRTTVSEPKHKEVPITSMVAEILKQKKLGLFQNELDYRVFFPHFKPDGNDAGRYRVDLAGFTWEGLVLTEFKLYDENIKTMNPWGVLHHICRDMEKLEAVARSNNGKQPGAVQIIVAVRNTDKKENFDQIKCMNDQWEMPQGRRPRIKDSNYFSILKAFDYRLQSERKDKLKWKSEWHSESKMRTSFLSCTADLK